MNILTKVYDSSALTICCLDFIRFEVERWHEGNVSPLSFSTNPHTVSVQSLVLKLRRAEIPESVSMKRKFLS